MPPWAKFVLRYGPAAGGFLWALVDYLRQEDAPEPIEWRRLMVRFSDTNSAEAKDDCWCTWDLVNVTNGSIDTSWTTGDYTTAETAFDTYFTALKPRMANICLVDSYRWYKRGFNPYSETKPFVESGPPDRVTTKAIAGTGSGGQAKQVAMSVTEKTPWPKHWGRFYLPFTIQPDLMGTMRWSTTAVDAVAGATNTLYNTLASSELFPVVPVTQVDKDAVRCLLGITKVQVDDVPDVIRRRRLNSVVYRKILP